jgi:hypothetical protein
MHEHARPETGLACLYIKNKLMARCTLVAFSLQLPVLLSLSAAAQSDPISQQDITLYWDYLSAECQAKAQTTQNPTYQAPNKNKPMEVELDDVTFNETGGLRADPKAKPGHPGSAEDLHDARVAVAEVAQRVLQSGHPEREQAPHTLTSETVRDLNAGNKDVIRALNDSLSAARSGSNTTHGAMHFRTGRHRFRSLYGHPATMYFGPFPDSAGGRRYLTIAP